MRCRRRVIRIRCVRKWVNVVRIVFWNIQHGGGRRAGKIVEQILEWNPDIVALAEFRGTAPSRSIAAALREAGFEHQLTTVDSDNPTWNALFLASRVKLTQLQIKGAPEPDLYWLLAEARTENPFHIGVVHAPWSIHLGRLEYYEALVNVAERWRFGPGVIIGDTNTGITGLDEETIDSACYHEKMTKPLRNLGWREMFRNFHPNVDAPTWYSSSGNGRRLDQAFVNAELQPHVTVAGMTGGAWEDQETERPRGADHRSGFGIRRGDQAGKMSASWISKPGRTSPPFKISLSVSVAAPSLV